MGKSLVIVESPTKARTISRYLGDDFVVESSIGHVRDLPQSAKEIPEKYKGEDWARLGIDIENDFQPLYVVPPEKKKQVTKLRKLLKEADELYLATDEDREGESISWHLCEVLQPDKPRKRLVFHEITREAIEKALENPRDIDFRLVQAQEARRLLDRLYGYEISPLLWKKIAPRLSAGRVQSVAVRMVVQRERERMAFRRSTYWDLAATFRPEEGPAFPATLVEADGKRVAGSKDFDETTGELKEASRDKVLLLDESGARSLLERLQAADWAVDSVERKPYTTRPAPPFTTSTLQQEANRKLRLSARESMRAAQRLYENGWITYMRTDSVTLSEEAIQAARDVARGLYGEESLASEPRRYQTKVKNAQEAHEAIRPSSEFHRPEEIRDQLSGVEHKLYELIWKRTVACQMAEARGHRITIRVRGDGAVFQASGKTVEFPGFLRAYVEGADDPEAELADKETLLPQLSRGDALRAESLEPKSHTTQPPARYTEATLVKALEASGVGRPSTYATIIDTILRREYVVKHGNALVPTFTAFAVVQLLERHFGRLVDAHFTARMEDELDSISLGEKEMLPYLQAFYFGNGQQWGLEKLVHQQDIDPRESCTLLLGHDSEGREIDVRVGRYGPFLERGNDRASVPENLAPDELTVEKAEELLALGSGPRQLGEHPETGQPVYVKVGRYGPYVQLGDKEEGQKPKMKSLLPGMEPAQVSLDAALQLLSLPRSLGTDPQNGEEVTVDYGRYGAYIRRGSDSRSLKQDDDLFEIDLNRALELLAQEPQRGRRARAQPKVLQELGKHPASGLPIQLLSGRYGPYVSDGELNASVPRGEDPANITLDRAVELLRAREEAGGRRKKKKKKAKKAAGTKGAKTAGKKTAKKKSGKKAAKKAAKKKKTTKKTAGKSAPKKTAKKAAKTRGRKAGGEETAGEATASARQASTSPRTAADSSSNRGRRKTQKQTGS